MIVAVQGELGSNSELAAREAFNSQPLEILPCHTFQDLFSAVGSGRATAGMAPVENSLAGSIHDVWDLLRQTSLPISGEIRLRVVHCLIGLPGATMEDIQRVRSHPQALAQCADYLESLGDVAVEEVYDTAGAVQIIKQEDDAGEAAIASAQAARDHDMQVLAEDLSASENFTRFLILGDVDTIAGADNTRQKTTILFDAEHTAAGLSSILGMLNAQGVEIVKVETHKRQGLPWVYGVYLEFVSSDPQRTAQAINALTAAVPNLKVVGTYPTGSAAEPRLHPR